MGDVVVAWDEELIGWDERRDAGIGADDSARPLPLLMFGFGIGTVRCCGEVSA